MLKITEVSYLTNRYCDVVVIMETILSLERHTYTYTVNDIVLSAVIYSGYTSLH